VEQPMTEIYRFAISVFAAWPVDISQTGLSVECTCILIFTDLPLTFRSNVDEHYPRTKQHPHAKPPGVL